MTAIARLFGWTNPVDLGSDILETKPVSSSEAEKPVRAVVVTRKKLAEPIQITVHYTYIDSTINYPYNDSTIEKVILYFSLVFLHILTIIGICLHKELRMMH